MTSPADPAPVDDDLSREVLAALTPARLHNGVLTLTVLLPAGQQQVWQSITEPEHLAQWSPVVPDAPFDATGPRTSRENPADVPVDATITDVRAPWALEHRWGADTLTWQLAPSGEGTQLNLVHELTDEQGAAEMASGWHVCLTVLQRQLRGEQTARCVGRDAIAHGWELVRDRYVEKFRPQDGQG